MFLQFLHLPTLHTNIDSLPLVTGSSTLSALSNFKHRIEYKKNCHLGYGTVFLVLPLSFNYDLSPEEAASSEEEEEENLFEKIDIEHVKKLMQ